MVSWLRRLFCPVSPAPPPAAAAASVSGKRTVFYHEDDYCQLQVLPAGAERACRAEMENGAAFAAAHRDGKYVTEMYFRKEPPGLEFLRISRSALKKAAETFAPAFDAVYTGYGMPPYPADETAAAWGTPRVTLFAGFTPDNLISVVWLTLDTASLTDKHDALKLFSCLGRLAQGLLFADWEWERLMRLDDTEALNAYLDQRTAVFSSLHSPGPEGKAPS